MFSRPDILRCPSCHGSLIHSSKRLSCQKCQADYLVENSIPDLMPHQIAPPIARMADVWNNIHYDYDEHISKSNPERIRPIDDPLLSECVGGKEVLEIGCGTARLKRMVEERGSHYVGLDPSLKLLRQGIARGERNLVRGVGEHLPFPDRYFDVIIGGYCSFRYIQRDTLYKECVRVLRPNGVLAFTLWNHWALFYHGLAINFRRGNFLIPPFRTGTCNDVISPFHEAKRLARFGFAIKSILSTRNLPVLSRRPILRRIFNWRGHWRGAWGALIGYDIIFVCTKSTE